MSDKIYLATQTILDNKENIHAYELLFRSPGATSAHIIDNTQATSRVLVNTLNSIGLDSLLGNKQGFINLNAEMLHDEIIDLLPSNKFILEILEFTVVDINLINRIQTLKEQGYHFAIDDVILDEKMFSNFEPLFPLVDLLKIEVINMDELTLRKIVTKFKPYNIKLLAEKVENREMFELCKKLGFDLYQGYYFSKPVVVEKKSLEPSMLALTKIVSQISSEAPPAKIEDTFKQAPALTTSLLRYMNSASIAIRREIRSIKHAINLIGTKKLMRWTILISYACDGKNPDTDPLLYLVQQRSKMMELLAAKTSVKINSDEAFMVGLLSLMDVAFGVKMSTVLGSMKLDDNIKDAVLHSKDNLGLLLQLVLTMETDQYHEVEKLSQELGLNVDVVNQARIAAIQWTMESTLQSTSTAA